MTHNEGMHFLQRVSTEKERWQNRQWFSTLSRYSTASALQGKADTFAVTTMEAVIISQATVFAFLSLYHHNLTVQTGEQGGELLQQPSLKRSALHGEQRKFLLHQ